MSMYSTLFSLEHDGFNTCRETSQSLLYLNIKHYPGRGRSYTGKGYSRKKCNWGEEGNFKINSLGWGFNVVVCSQLNCDGEGGSFIELKFECKSLIFLARKHML